MQQLIGETTAKLISKEIPEVKARHKARSLRDGLVVTMVGILLLLCAAGLVLVPVFTLREQPGVPFLLFAVTLAVGGLFLVFVGGNIISGEAAQAAGGLFGVIAAAAERLRGKA